MVKKILPFVLIAGLSFAEYNFNQTVTSTSTRIAAQGNASAASLSVPQAVEQGDLVTVGQRVYMAVEAGTVTVVPTHTTGEAGSPLLRFYKSRRGTTSFNTERRVVVFVDNTGENTIWLSVGSGDAVDGKGIRLEAGDRVWFSMDKAVNAVAPDGNSTVAVQEIY